MVKRKTILATLLILLSFSIIAVSADIGAWLDDEDTGEGNYSETWSQVKCWANEYGYSSITYPRSKTIKDDNFDDIQWADGYPDTYPGGTSASFGTDMGNEGMAEVWTSLGEFWVEDPGSYSHAHIDG